MPIDSDLLPLPIPIVPITEPGLTEPEYRTLPTNTIIEASKTALRSHGILFWNSYNQENDSYTIRISESTPVSLELGNHLRRQGWLGFGDKWTFAGVWKRSRSSGQQRLTCAALPDPNIMA